MRQAVPFLVLILAAALAQAQAPATAPVPDSPKRKSGLWEITSVRGEGKSWSVKMCVDQATDEPLAHLNGPVRKESCKADKIQRSGDQTTVDAVCAQKKGAAKTHAVITGKFDSAYKIETTSIYDPPLRGKAEGTTTLEGRWLGPCAADQRPGDVMLADGRRVNINERVPGASARKSQAAPSSPSGSRSSKQSSSPASNPGGATPTQPSSQPPSQ